MAVHSSSVSFAISTLQLVQNKVSLLLVIIHVFDVIFLVEGGAGKMFGWNVYFTGFTSVFTANV